MSNIDPNDPNILGLECRHVVYSESKDKQSDLLLVKETVHYKDGTTKPNLRKIINYRRPFYITRDEHRNHKQKKEYESRDKLIEFKTPQFQLRRAIALAFNGRLDPNRSLSQMCRNPYIYGADILPEVLIKERYQAKWPALVTPNSVAALDIETSVVNPDGTLGGDGKPIIVTLTCKDKIFCAVRESFVKGRVSDPKKAVFDAAEEHLGTDLKERNIGFNDKHIKFVVLPTAGQCCKWVIDRAHELQSEFVAIWNIDFDVPKMNAAMEEEGYDLEEVWSDPSIPKKYRKAYYKKGKPYRITERGVKQNLASYQRWNWFFTMSSFIVIDAQATYYTMRIANGKYRGYGLDACLDREVGRRKLRFEKAEFVGHGLAWHQYMQHYYPVEYIIYNWFDDIGAEIIDEKTNDLALALSAECGPSDYYQYKYKSIHTANGMHFEARDNGLVIGTVSDKMALDIDKYTITRKGHIITLQSSLYDTSECIQPFYDSDVTTQISFSVSDIDIKSSYPFGQITMNTDKPTTRYELCNISGVTEITKRKSIFNLTYGTVNQPEICVDIMGATDYDDMLDKYDATHVA